MATLRLYDTLTREKREFAPADPKNVRFYVCGPTVYARPHIGNARSVVVYDVLFRLLRHNYGEEHVTYARNITDVEDKINAEATRRGITIHELTEEVTAGFHADMDALNVLRPTIEPRPTGHMPEIIAMTERLIANGNAYVQEGHVLFDVASIGEGDYHYGQLSGRKMEDLIAGARVEVQGYKKNPGDFVLWKPASAKDDASSVFESPWGAGRPGWHIECSAMSTKHLGLNFDLHGGGADLMFPHHENEIAQSRCAHPGSGYAKLWMHNGFLTVNGEKMSKSLGNFVTVQDLLAKGVKGEVIRYALLSTSYNKPLDWTEKFLKDAQKVMDRLYKALLHDPMENVTLREDHIFEGVIHALDDNLNTPLALSLLQSLESDTLTLLATGRLLGLLKQNPRDWFASQAVQPKDDSIQLLIENRIAAKKAKDWKEADRIRNALTDMGIILEDKPDGTTGWRWK